MGINNAKEIPTIEKSLRQLDSIIRKKGREILKDENLTIPQFNALQFLLFKKNATIGELSQWMDLAFSTVTDMVNRMEENGYVKRKRDHQDRRVVRLVVLDKGYAIVKEVIKIREDFIGEALEDESDEFVIEFSKALEKCLALIQKTEKANKSKEDED